ncbi:hypothetical protein DRN73_01570 [Candidatus Pacearchaeota archaeon]|nr:MAG: hypothetical protein DRN73_01570 [Candidatus Pacearchaeota archaeon]
MIHNHIKKDFFKKLVFNTSGAGLETRQRSFPRALSYLNEFKPINRVLKKASGAGLEPTT